MRVNGGSDRRVVLASVNWFLIPDLAGTCLRNWARRDEELAGVAIDMVDVRREHAPAASARRILKDRPALVGFTCYLWNVGLILDIARHIKRLSPSTMIVLGGAEVAPIPDKTLGANPQVDFVALGEGEETFRLLLHAVLLRDRAPALVPGLAFRDGGKVVKTAPAPLIDLAASPAVYAGGDAGKDEPTVMLEAARGCPFLCSFCDWGPRQMRYFPLERMEREIRALAAAEHSRLVILCDADLLMDKRHGLAVMEMVSAAAKGREFAFQFDTNPMFLCDEAIDIIARDPTVFYLSFGLQTVNEKTLERLHRPFDMRRAEANLRRLKRIVPRAHLSFSIIYGLPGDDLNGFRATIDWVLQWKPVLFRASQLMMLPGADIIDEKHSPKLSYQTEPPYQVYETDAMSRADMARARELAYYCALLFSFRSMAFQSAVDILFGGERDLSTMKAGSRVLLLEGWIEHLKASGIDLTFGMPVLETDETVQRQRYFSALERLEKDKLAAAAVLHATRRFAGLASAAV